MSDAVGSALARVAEAWRPRILTQLCRDPSSPFYGCADRNWWHYKIRDFPSIILQQAGYAAYLMGAGRWADIREPLDALAAASARFWNARALRHGAFEEYYPYEQGYPPLAFATLAMAKLADAGVVPVADIAPGLRIAARQLRSRFEPQAANQQVAGLAALAWIDRLLPAEADPTRFAELTARTLALQTPEGWLWEYDGPDLGYLAVSLDCLWDLLDATGDEAFRQPIDDAIAFMAKVYAAAPGGAGMLNARNTDYLAPYGIVRAALEGNAEAVFVAEAAFARANDPEHAFAAVDDRYICHYLGHSVLRAAALLENRRFELAPAPVVAALLPECGYYLDSARQLAVACRKGGIVSLAGEAEFGWIVERGAKQFVTHWWSREWTFATEGDAVRIAGGLFEHAERASTPLKHVVLRALSFILGRRLIALLKRALIFKRGGADIAFERVIRVRAHDVEIVDRFAGLRATDRLRRAPRASKRHVASADSYHREDLSISVHEDGRTVLNDGRLEVRTLVGEN